MGDKLRTKTHGRGKGAARICSDVFLDDESLLKFQAEQQALHARRMAEDGLPGYVDLHQGRDLQLTLFRETQPVIGKLRVGQPLGGVAPAGIDRRTNGPRVNGKGHGHQACFRCVDAGDTAIGCRRRSPGAAGLGTALGRVVSRGAACVPY